MESVVLLAEVVVTYDELAGKRRFTPKFTNQKLAYETGTLNTLYEISLTEEVKNDKRHNNHHTTGVLNYVVVNAGTCHVILSKSTGNVLIYIRHHVNLVRCTELCGKEYARIELICPLPREGEEEDGNHHGNGKRYDNLEERTEYTRAVNVCRLLKLIGNALEELTHQVDVKTVLYTA